MRRLACACGQATRPAAAKLATEIADTMNDRPFLSPFIWLRSRIPHSENNASSMIPRPPVEVASVVREDDRPDVSVGTRSGGVLLHQVPEMIAKREHERGQRQKDAEFA